MLCCQLDISAFADLLYHALQDAVLTEEIADHGTYNLCKCFLGALELLIKTIDSTVCSTCCVHSMYIYVHGKCFKCKLAGYWTHNFTSHTSHKQIFTIQIAQQLLLQWKVVHSRQNPTYVVRLERI